MKEFNFSKWIIVNILLPLSPFFLRIYMSIMGNQKIKVFETPEILFFSIFTCITSLNINSEGRKRYFESIVRLFLMIIMVLDFVTLAMIYSNNIGPYLKRFSVMSAIIPTIIAPLYKFYFSNRKGVDKK